MSGKIYFVSAPGRIKVGYTKQPEKRLRALQSGDMEQLVTLGVIDGGRGTEKYLHELLREYRLRGEWFRDCEAVRSIVAQALSGGISLPKVVESEPIVATEADRSFDPRLMSACAERATQLMAAINRGEDKHKIKAMSGELIALSEVMIGLPIIKDTPAGQGELK